MPPEQDLWIRYFTSSKIIGKMIEEDGADSFTAKIVSRHETGEEAYWAEQDLIKRAIKEPGCLNRHYVDPTGKKKFSTLGVSPSSTRRIEIGNFHRGLVRGPQSPEHRERIGAPQRGVPRAPHTPESKAKLSRSLTGKTVWVRKEQPVKIRTEDLQNYLAAGYVRGRGKIIRRSV